MASVVAGFGACKSSLLIHDGIAHYVSVDAGSPTGKPEDSGSGLDSEAALPALDYGFRVTALRTTWLEVREPSTPGIRGYAAVDFKPVSRPCQSGYWLGALR